MKIKEMLLSPCEDDFDLVIEILKTKGYSRCRIKEFLDNFFENFENFVTFFKANQPKDSLILIKGSRGMALEKTLELI